MWIFFAIVSYFLAAVVLILDKFILSRPIPNASLYATYVGLLGIYGLFLAPFGFTPFSVPPPVLFLSLGSGFMFIFALIFSYRAVLLGEVSRVAPLIGVLTAVLTLTVSDLFSVEKLGNLNKLAFLFFVSGGILISFRRPIPSSFKIMIPALLASFLFAASFVLIKAAFLKTAFLNAYILGRLGEFAAGLFLFSLPSVRRALFTHLKNAEMKTVGLFFINKVLAGSYFIMLNYAVFLGSVSLVSGMQGLQYAFLFVLTAVVSLKFPQVLKEETGKNVLVGKTIAVILITFGLFLLYAASDSELFPGTEKYGATFSYSWAEKLGLNPREAYLAALDDLKIRRLRLPFYWNEIEKADGEYNFENYDWQVEEAKKRGVKIIAAVGRKLPRWPECHEPEWMKNEPKSVKDEKLLGYISAVVNRYKENGVIWAWQVENEPFLPFGECPKLDKNLLNSEIEFVRSLDSRPVIITDSGELSLWHQAAKRADIFGTTMYRTVWNKWIPFGGYFKYPLPPSFFHLKANLVRLFAPVEKIIVVELQAEPWGPKLLYELTPEEQLRYFNLEQFKENLRYSRKAGFPEVYLWGTEWWYWMKEKQNRPEFWEEAGKLFGGALPQAEK